MPTGHRLKYYNQALAHYLPTWSSLWPPSSLWPMAILIGSVVADSTCYINCNTRHDACLATCLGPVVKCLKDCAHDFDDCNSNCGWGMIDQCPSGKGYVGEPNAITLSRYTTIMRGVSNEKGYRPFILNECANSISFKFHNQYLEGVGNEQLYLPWVSWSWHLVVYSRALPCHDARCAKESHGSTVGTGVT